MTAELSQEARSAIRAAKSAKPDGWHLHCFYAPLRAAVSQGHTQRRRFKSQLNDFRAGRTVRVRIVRLPPAPLVDGVDMQRFRTGMVGQIYDVPSDLARYLVAAGYAEDAERPEVDRAADRSRKSKPSK